MAFSLRGAMHGLGGAMETSGLLMLKEQLEEDRQTRLLEVQAAYSKQAQERGFEHDKGMVDVREKSRQAGRQADIDQDTLPENIAKKGAAASGLINATLPARLEERKQLMAVDTQAKVEEFSKLAPLQRQEAIDSAVAVLKAQSTPEMLRATRQIAQAKHIVDPSYTLITDEDGEVRPFDSKSGKLGKALLGDDDKPLVRKDPETLKAAISVINMANTNLKIAQAEHKAAMSDTTLDPASRARGEAEWQAAQAEARRLTAPAYVVLYGKAGIPSMAVEKKPGSTIVDPFKKAAPAKPATTPAAPSGPGGVNSVLTPQDQAKINAAPSPAARTQIRQGIIKERMREAQAAKEVEGSEEEDRLRALGIDPAAAAFSVR